MFSKVQDMFIVIKHHSWYICHKNTLGLLIIYIPAISQERCAL